MNRSKWNPLTDNAAVIDDGPGNGETEIPAATARETSSAPGSFTPGVPASLTNAASESASNATMRSSTDFGECRW